jgi:hypothetical protein
MTDRRVVDGVRLPDDSSLTENERAWVELLRSISAGQDPAPTLAPSQALQLLLREPAVPMPSGRWRSRPR